MILALSLLASAPLFVTPAEAARRKTDYLDKPIPDWREGPVRYIITKWEDDEYKSLDTEEQRARFIESFWQRRDADPATPGNEFRAQFWKRVRDANHLYGEETAKEGWRTDMGKIHILRGPPDEITRDLMGAGHRGTVIWVYRNAGAVPGVGPNVVVAFARDVTGEFRLSSEPSRDSDPKEGGPLPYQPPMGTNRLAQAQLRQAQDRIAKLFNFTDPLIRQAGGPTTATSLELITQLAKLQQPPREWEVRETVTTQEFFGAVPMRARADFFATTTEHTLVLITIAVSSSAVHYRRVGSRDLPDVALYGRVLDVTGNDLVASLEADDAFVPASENQNARLDDDLLFQGRALLMPGSYKVRLTALDRAGGRAGTHEIPVTVPDFTGAGLTLSSLLLARSIEPVTDSQADGDMSPFVLGQLRLLPRLGHSFTTEDDLAFYYQVYGAARDPGTDKPSLDVDYGFFTVSSEQLQELGHVTFEARDTQVQGYSLSLDGWPPGPYMLRVAIRDRVAGTTASGDLVFQIR